MSFQYSSEIVTTSTGVVDIEYYRLETSRLRNEKMAEILVNMFKSVKKLTQFKFSDNYGPSNLFLLGKLAK